MGSMIAKALISQLLKKAVLDRILPLIIDRFMEKAVQIIEKWFKKMESK